MHFFSGGRGAGPAFGGTVDGEVLFEDAEYER
jgi:hypothetical protein